MEADKEFLETYSVVLGIDKAIDEIRHEADEKGIEKGIEKEREEFIMRIRNNMGFSAEQIANMSHFPVEYIQSVIDKYEKKKKS